MRALKLRPWPFKSYEEVELYWLCSTFLKPEIGWYIRVAFKLKNEIIMVEFPWGTLPYLHLGKKYKDGLPLENSKKGVIGEVSITNQEFKICTGFDDMPTSLYYFYKNTECGNQRLCKFKVNSKTYYIPCSELVRSFFAKSKTLANYIMKPNGLDFLIEGAVIKENNLSLSLSFEFPKAIVSDATVTHLSWIRYNEQAYETWTSVYNNLYNKALKSNSTNPINKLVRGIPIEIYPPIRENTKWVYRGISKDDNILILELTVAYGFELPFNSISYYHPSFEKSKTERDNNGIRKINKDDEEILKLPDEKEQSESGKKQQYQPIVETSSTAFVFDNLMKVNRINGGIKDRKEGLNIISHTPGKENHQITNGETYTTQDWSGSGKIDSLEFNNLDVVKGKLGKGLEEFYKAIEFIKNNYKGVNISMCEVFLPLGKGFSYYPDGDRRNCAIVRINNKDALMCYIFEVGRYDNWSISTMFIYLDDRDDNYDNKAMHLIGNLVSNNGHWDKEFINSKLKCEFKILKHIKNEKFKQRINKIISKCEMVRNV
ncbi:Tn7-like element transposition protein TnsE [Clostridium sp. CS001]|uniref:Tn7-like element transposition protein TnsE n=1 Tax=Clostridium sp. CS001 TaxID=2880648 RepID=UPI001CF2EE86|nr:Tn7-like element transposition protein TnsE [Clostridium sp. CS001]MCB2291589.1 Tn7-like element transposition protein TnsE [Clostridium sp. CS001]